MIPSLACKITLFTCNKPPEHEWKNSSVPEIVCFNSGVYAAEELHFLPGAITASDHKCDVLLRLYPIQSQDIELLVSPDVQGLDRVPAIELKRQYTHADQI